jgi:hypothetical protein
MHAFAGLKVNSSKPLADACFVMACNMLVILHRGGKYKIGGNKPQNPEAEGGVS